MRQISLQRGGAMLAVLLGFGLLLARTGPEQPVVATQPESVLSSIEAKEDHVLPVDLAKRIIEGRKDFTLVDVRSAWEFDDYTSRERLTCRCRSSSVLRERAFCERIGRSSCTPAEERTPPRRGSC